VDSSHVFATEAELQNVMIANLERIPVNGKTLTFIGKEWETAAGFIDIYAKDDEENLYVIECKLSAAKDVAVAQTIRYMGAIRQETGTDKKIVGVLVSQGFEPHAKLAASAVPGFVLMDYKTSILPFCQETVNLNGVVVPVHKGSFGWCGEELIKLDIASDFEDKKYSRTVLKFHGNGIAASLNLTGSYERRALITAFRFAAEVLGADDNQRAGDIADWVRTEQNESPRECSDILQELGLRPSEFEAAQSS